MLAVCFQGPISVARGTFKGLYGVYSVIQEILHRDIAGILGPVWVFTKVRIPSKGFVPKKGMPFLCVPLFRETNITVIQCHGGSEGNVCRKSMVPVVAHLAY